MDLRKSHTGLKRRQTDSTEWGVYDGMCKLLMPSGSQVRKRFVWKMDLDPTTWERNITMWHYYTISGGQKASGDLSAYRQQQRSLESLDDDTCPREAVLRDILILVDTWQQKGVQIILMGDFNEDITLHKLKVRLEQKGLGEIFSTQHGQPPNTYNRGTRPIDGIFTTSNIISIQLTGSIRPCVAF